MNDKKIQIAMAEIAGWVRQDHSYPYPESSTGICTSIVWLNPSGADQPLGDDILPDYLNDLNAVHEVEKLLKGADQLGYLAALTRRDIYCSWPSVTATARQRCEALLRTLGKWEDS